VVPHGCKVNSRFGPPSTIHKLRLTAGSRKRTTTESRDRHGRRQSMDWVGLPSTDQWNEIWASVYVTVSRSNRIVTSNILFVVLQQNTRRRQRPQECRDPRRQPDSNLLCNLLELPTELWLTKPKETTSTSGTCLTRNHGNQRSTTFNRCRTPVIKSRLWLTQLHNNLSFKYSN